VRLRRGEAIFAECNTEKSGLATRRRQELPSLAEAAGAAPLLSVRRKRKLIVKNLRTGKIVQTNRMATRAEMRYLDEQEKKVKSSDIFFPLNYQSNQHV